MAAYEIKSHKQYYAGAGNWLTICEVETIEPDNYQELSEDEWVVNQFYVVLGCDHLVVYDMPTDPFDCEDSEEHDRYVAIDYYLPECELDWLLCCYPELNYKDWTDPVVFVDIDQETFKPFRLNEYNDLYVACWYQYKADLNRKGFC